MDIAVGVVASGGHCAVIHVLGKISGEWQQSERSL